ncbi:MAG: hypothetical protein ACREAB_08815 [Blastocatellia bacterium]
MRKSCGAVWRSSRNIDFIIDLAEVPAFQETQKADPDSDGNLSEAELNGYLGQVTPGYLAGLKLTADGAPVALWLTGKTIGRLPGAAGLFTLRIVYELAGEFSSANSAPRLRFENANTADRAITTCFIPVTPSRLHF